MATPTEAGGGEYKLSVAEIESDKKVERERKLVERERKLVETVQRAQWLRAALLGANDGLLSTTSIMLGVGAAKEDRKFMILSGIAGSVAGACSMAVGEFVSVSTQREIEKMAAHHNSETKQSDPDPGHELPAVNTPSRTSLPPTPLMTPGRRFGNVLQMRSPAANAIVTDRKDDNIDIGNEKLPSPLKAGGASALAFLLGSLVPLLSTMFVSDNRTRIVMLPVVTSIALVLFGGVGAYLGGSPVRISAIRVLIGGWMAMLITYGLLKPFDRDDAKGKHAD